MQESTPARFQVAPADGPTLLAAHEAMFKGMGPVLEQYFPNSLLIMGRDPDLLAAVVQLGGVVMRRPGRLGLELKWLMGHVASATSGCRYCAAHTAEHGTEIAVTPHKMAEVWDFEHSRLFTDAERSALRFSVEAAQHPNAVTPSTYDELHRFYDDDAIVEMVAVVSYWAFLNRWNDTLATPLEDKPLRYGQEHLSTHGWEPGRHADGPASSRH